MAQLWLGDVRSKMGCKSACKKFSKKSELAPLWHVATSRTADGDACGGAVRQSGDACGGAVR